MWIILPRILPCKFRICECESIWVVILVHVHRVVYDVGATFGNTPTATCFRPYTGSDIWTCSLYGSNGWFSSNPIHPSFINIYSTSTNTRSHMLEIFRHTIQWYSSVSVSIHRFFRRGRSYAESSSFVDDQGMMVLMSITGHRSFFHTPRPPRSSRTMNRLWNATMIHMVMNVRGNMYSKKRANEVWPRGSSSTTFIPKAFCGAIISIRHSC